MEARNFSHERKCAATKDVNTEREQKEYAFFVFFACFNQKVLSAKIPSKDILHTDGVIIFRKEIVTWISP